MNIFDFKEIIEKLRKYLVIIIVFESNFKNNLYCIVESNYMMVR